MKHTRNVSQPKPVRPFKRFMDTKQCNTGVDPNKIYQNFASRDTFFNMHRERRTITLNEDFATVPRGKVPHGTTKHTFKLGLGEDARLNRNSIGLHAQTFPRSPTDHISSEPPAQERPFQGLFDSMVQESKYEKNTKTTNPWAPKPAKIRTISNRNSVTHNILSFEPNKYTPALSYTERLQQGVGRQKGIAEIDDLKRITAVNRNVDHIAAMSGNEKVFARKDGIFTHLYNSAARFGEDKPFKA